MLEPLEADDALDAVELAEVAAAAGGLAGEDQPVGGVVGGCAVGVGGRGKWLTLYGDYPMQSAEDIIAAARMHGRTGDGIIPKDVRPPELKKRTISRTPPVA